MQLHIARDHNHESVDFSSATLRQDQETAQKYVGKLASLAEKWREQPKSIM